MQFTRKFLSSSLLTSHVVEHIFIGTAVYTTLQQSIETHHNVTNKRHVNSCHVVIIYLAEMCFKNSCK